MIQTGRKQKGVETQEKRKHNVNFHGFLSEDLPPLSSTKSSYNSHKKPGFANFKKQRTDFRTTAVKGGRSSQKEEHQRGNALKSVHKCCPNL